MSKFKGMNWTEVKKYIVVMNHNGGPVSWTIEFFPVPKEIPYPGVSHRVAIGGVLKDVLSDRYQPNRESALFFLEKHTEVIRNRFKQEEA